MDAHAIDAWFRLLEWSPADPSWSQRRKATWAWRKFKKARQWARVLRLVPFVRMIAIGNALGYGNCSPESDIDLVIVTAPRRVWTVRLFVVALLRLFRQRPGEHDVDAICPSFFLTTEAMDLEPLQIGNSPLSTLHSPLPPDPYLLWWTTQLTVLYDKAGTYDAFWRANEQWVRRWLPDAQPRAAHPRLCASNSPTLSVGDSWVGSAVERWCRRFQERRFSSEVRSLANRDSRVVLTDRMLKFHTNDRRQEYRDRWLEHLCT
ncbi:hypothetical protein HY635_00460 [Candidatus Uhrbacteria bacterium]|nr:hypothetical protein [Candidatus Uhrbacteria bacterium]